MREIRYTRAAIRHLRKIDHKTCDRIRAKMRQYAEAPEGLANVVSDLDDRPGKRLRVGQYRIIFEETETTIDVLDVGPRGSVYRRR